MTLTTKTIFPIILTTIFAIGLLFAGQWSKKLGIIVSDNKYISGQFNYQMVLLSIVTISVLTTYLLTKFHHILFIRTNFSHWTRTKIVWH